MKNLVYLCSLFLLISCSTTPKVPDYSKYPLYERDMPNTVKSDVEPGTVLNCYHDSGGVDSYYFGTSEEEERVVRIIDITNDSVLNNRRVILQGLQFITLPSDSLISMREIENSGRSAMNCPYGLRPGDNRFLMTEMWDRTTLINKNFLTFQQTHTKVFLDRTDPNNPVCREGRTRVSKGYCKVVSGFNKDYKEFIEEYTFPSSQL